MGDLCFPCVAFFASVESCFELYSSLEHVRFWRFLEDPDYFFSILDVISDARTVN